jgi:HSP20 family molecular chaperone IbpA
MSEIPPEDFKNIEDLLRRILSQAFGQASARPGVIGVNIIMAGNLPPGFPGAGSSASGHDIEHPPIEIVQYDNNLYATCELKGLYDEHISVAIADNTLHIIGFDGFIRYKSSILLPPVIESSCRRSFHNGILELTYQMKQDIPVITVNEQEKVENEMKTEKE